MSDIFDEISAAPAQPKRDIFDDLSDEMSAVKPERFQPRPAIGGMAPAGFDRNVVGIASESDKKARAEIDYLKENAESVVRPTPGLALAHGMKGAGGLVRQVGDLAGVESLRETGKEWAEAGEAATAGAREQYPLNPESWAEDVRGGLTSTVMQAPFMVAALPVAGVNATAATLMNLAPLVAITEGDAYDKYRNEGFDPGLASLGAGVEAAIEGITEFIPMKQILKVASPVVKKGVLEFVKGALKYGGEEHIGETLATLGQDLTERIMAKPGATASEHEQNILAYFQPDPVTGKIPAWENFKSTQVATATQNLLMGGVGAGAGMLANPSETTPQRPGPLQNSVDKGTAPAGGTTATSTPSAADTGDVFDQLERDGSVDKVDESTGLVRDNAVNEAMSSELDVLDEMDEPTGPMVQEVGALSRAVNKGPTPPLVAPVVQQDIGQKGGVVNDLPEVRQKTGGTQEVPSVRGEAVAPTETANQISPTPLDTQAHEAATSPANDLAEPSLAQIEAGNYKKGHIKLQGLDISVENPAGSTRKGVDESGRQWQTDLAHHYGYIKGTVGKDKDHIDVFVKPGIDETTAGNTVFVVDQKNTKTGKFDEHKVMLGFRSAAEAREAYLANYDQTGPDRIMDVTAATVDGFKSWLASGKTKEPFSPSVGRNHEKNRADFLRTASETTTRFIGEKRRDGKTGFEFTESIMERFPDPKDRRVSGPNGGKRLPDNTLISAGEAEYLAFLEGRQPGQANQQTAEQKEIAEVMADPRLKRAVYRDNLEAFVASGVDAVASKDTGKLIQDASGAVIGRQPSPNREDLRPAIQLAGGVQALVTAVKKAATGKPLGINQARAVKSVLDAMADQRRQIDNEDRRDLLNMVRRKAVREGELLDGAPVLDDGDFSDTSREEYPEEWDEETRTIADLAHEAEKLLGRAAVDAILDGSKDDQHIAVELYAAIAKGKANGRESESRTGVAEAAARTEETTAEEGITPPPLVDKTPDGDQTKLFATPPTFGKGAKGENATGSTAGELFTAADDKTQDNLPLSSEKTVEKSDESDNIEGDKTGDAAPVKETVNGTQTRDDEGRNRRTLEEILSHVLRVQRDRSESRPDFIARQSAALREWAEQNGVLIDHQSFTDKWNRGTAEQGRIQGTEQQVVIIDDADIVEKRKQLIGDSETWADYFARLLEHNRLFPELAYTFKGFSDVPTLRDGERFMARVDQPLSTPQGEFVEQDDGKEKFVPRLVTPEESAAYFESRGFVKEVDPAYAKLAGQGYDKTHYFQWRHPETGVVISDLSPGNIWWDVNGEIAVIDARIDVPAAASKANTLAKKEGNKADKKTEGKIEPQWEKARETFIRENNIVAALAALKEQEGTDWSQWGDDTTAFEIIKEAARRMDGNTRSILAALRPLVHQRKDGSVLDKDGMFDRVAELFAYRYDVLRDAFTEAYENATGKKIDHVSTHEKVNEKITDTGENLYANRRNWTGRGISWDDIKDQNDTLKVKEAVKAKVWPKPDYEQMVADGMPAIVARVVKQVYDGVAVKPAGTTDEQIRTYIESVNRVKEVLLNWSRDGKAIGEFADAALATVKQAQRGRVSLIDMMNTDRALQFLLLDRFFPGERNKPRPEQFAKGTPERAELSSLGGNRFYQAAQITTNDLVVLTKDVTRGWPTKQEAWERQGYQVIPSEGFHVNVHKDQRTDGTPTAYLSLVKQIGSRYRTIAETWLRGDIGEQALATASKALEEQAAQPFLLVDKRWRLISQHASEEEAKTAARDTVKREGGSRDLRGMNIGEAVRQGEARRQEGENITAEQFKDFFGFRGVNFGREGWINQAERQEYLNQAYDALLDLAEILEVPPKALSLDGMLGIAFGAQGRGGHAAAHFVPGHNEINLTKTMGAGTLAHELGHALDHHFGKQAGLAKDDRPYLSERSAKTGSEVRPEIVETFKAIVQAMNRRPLSAEEITAQRDKYRQREIRQRDANLDFLRNQLAAGTPEEKRTEALTAFDALADRVKAGDLGDGYVTVYKSPRGRMSDVAVRAVVGEIRDLFKKYTTSRVPMDSLKALNQQVGTLDYLDRQEQAEDSHAPQDTASNYARESAAKDRGKKKPYWGTNVEKFARAFELYVHMKLTEREQVNTFLSDAAIRAETLDPEGGYAQPYPRNEEAGAIKAAFDVLFDTIETRETEQGVAMFAASDKEQAANLPLSDEVFDATFDKLMVGRKDRKGFEVVRRGADLPARVVAEMHKRGWNVEAANAVFFDGRVYLVRDNITSQAFLEEVVFHEWHGHGGLFSMFGENDAKVKAAMLDLYHSLQPGELLRLARKYKFPLPKYAKGLRQAGYSDDARRAAVVEELLAFMTKEYSRGKIAAKVKEIIGMIRAWLREHGFAELAKMNEFDLALLLKKARAYADTGTWAKDAGPVAIDGKALLEKLHERGVTDDMLLQFMAGVPRFAANEGQTAARNDGPGNDVRFHLSDTAERISPQDAVEKMKGLLNPLDYSRLRKTAEKRLSGRTKHAIGFLLQTPYWKQAEADKAAVPFYEEGRIREEERHTYNIRMRGGQAQGGKVKGSPWQRFKDGFNWTDEHTVWEEIKRQVYNTLTNEERAALDVLVVEGDARNVEYGSLGRALLNPAVKAAGVNGKVFSAYQALMQAKDKAFDIALDIEKEIMVEAGVDPEKIEKSIAEKRQMGKAKVEFTTLEEGDNLTVTLSRDQATINVVHQLRKVAKAFGTTAVKTDKGDIVVVFKASDNEAVREALSHVLANRIRGHMHRDHGDGEHVVTVHQVIDRLDFEEREITTKAGKPAVQMFLPYYPGRELAEKIEELAGALGGSFLQLDGKGEIIVTFRETEAEEARQKLAALVDNKKPRRVMVYSRYVETEHAADELKAEVEKNLAKAMPINFRKGASYEVSSAMSESIREEEYQAAVTGSYALDRISEETLKKMVIRGEIGEKESQGILDEYREGLAETLLARGAGATMIRRVPYLIEGYERGNVMGNFEQQLNGTAGMLSKAVYALRQYKHLQTVPTRTRRWAVSYIENTLRNMGRADRISGDVRGLASLWYLGGNLTWMLINHTQPYVFGVAELSRHIAEGKLFTREQGALRRILTAEKDILARKQSAEEKGLWADPRVQVQIEETVMAEMAGSDSGVGGKVSQAIHTAARVSMVHGHKIEVLNRKVVILAAYRTFRAQGLGHAQALDRALEVNSAVNIDMGRYNLPGFAAKSTIGRTLYTLQSFVQHAWNYLYYRSTSGKKEDQKAVLRLLFAMALLGGLPAGAPGSDELDKLMLKWFGYSPKLHLRSWTRKNAKKYDQIGEMLDDFVWHGLPGIAGVSLTGSVQFRLPIITNMIDGDTGFRAMGGAVGGLAEKGLKGIEAARKGDYDRALENIAPSAIANIMSAHRQMTEGVRTTHGKPTFYQGRPIKMTASEAIRRAAGMQPARTADISETKGFEIDLRSEWGDRRQAALDKYRQTRDMKAVQAFNKELQSSQAKALVSPITTDMLRDKAKPNKRQAQFQGMYGLD